jgi:hypothetical protein
MVDFFEELKASGSVRFGERSCQSSYQLRMSSKHRGTHIDRLQVKPKAIFFSQALRPYTWDSKGRSLQILQK